MKLRTYYAYVQLLLYFLILVWCSSYKSTLFITLVYKSKMFNKITGDLIKSRMHSIDGALFYATQAFSLFDNYFLISLKTYF